MLADSGTRRHRLTTAAMYAVLCSSVVWLWSVDFSGLYGFIGGNAYVWIGLALLFLLPVSPSAGLETGDGPELVLRQQLKFARPLPDRAGVG